MQLDSMPSKPAQNEQTTEREQSAISWKWEGLGILALGLMLAWFLGLSWRRWPDPIVDFGQQCYSVWRLSQGDALYHDFTWNYGPVSIYFHSLLFRCFGPGIMVLAASNLVVYGLILSLMYLAFRVAWGWVGAFAALAVFISVFSFSHLLAVGNYNYATPYAAESTHGMLIILAGAFVTFRWQRQKSLKLAFALGLCGGLAAVMKPEFMLATGVLGAAGCALRWAQQEHIGAAEFALLLAGAALPTLLFAIWFARTESWRQSFIDASQAWWLVVVDRIQNGNPQQTSFSGVDRPWFNALMQLKATFWAAAILGSVWASGWFVNRPWSLIIRMATALAAVAIACSVRLDGGWFNVGRCLPGLMVAALVVVGMKAWREVRATGRVESGTVMALLLVLLAGTMMARMPLFTRISHLGFFQAALAGMVTAAMAVAELPRWTGPGSWGRRVAMLGCFAVLAVGCASIAAQSWRIRVDQTEAVGWGRDRFYATTWKIDGTGALVNWAATWLRKTPPDATVLVLPEGTMINYLSRHKSLEPGLVRGEAETVFLGQMQRTPPEYVVLITRDLREFGVARFGAPGNMGSEIMKWVSNNYSLETGLGGDPLAIDDHPGAMILRRRQ